MAAGEAITRGCNWSTVLLYCQLVGNKESTNIYTKSVSCIGIEDRNVHLF